jgi:hypothetical protein
MTKILLIIVIVLVIGGYLGFQTLAKPTDLKASYTPADIISVQTKSSNLPTTVTFTQAEINAALNQNPYPDKWLNQPISHVQLKLNPDGTTQVSGNILVGQLIPYFAMAKYTHPQMGQAMEQLKKLPLNPPFFVTGQASIVDNKISVNVTSAKVSIVTIPQDIVTQNQGEINRFAQGRLDALTDLYIKSAVITDGQLKIDAQRR